MFTPIQKILPKAIKKLGLAREVEAALICEKYRKLAPQLIHVNALQHTSPKFYRGKTLTIGVVNSSWAAALMAQKERLIELINKELGKKMVADLKTRVVESIAPSPDSR
jgi:predicted nucleic acid-binding Zn ribbon protein